MGSHSSAIQAYIRAKDENRPHLMPSAFASDASLATRVETENISFPPASKGIEEITQVLVRDFGLAYENIYTFCLDRAPSDGEAAFRPLRESVPPAIDLTGPMPYVAVQQLLDPPNPKGMRNYWTADFYEAMPDEALVTIAEWPTCRFFP
jgi:hypothetical protein